MSSAVNEDSKENQIRVLESMAEIFYSLHIINLKDDSVEPYSSRDRVALIVDHKYGAKKMMEEVMRTTTIKEHQELAVNFTDLSTIAKRMKNRKTISAEFRGAHIGWFVAMFISVEYDSEGYPTRVVFATRIIDEEKREIESLLKIAQTDELTGLLNRRTYEQQIYKNNIIPTEDNFAYIVFDINGLKLVNDTISHLAGDELILGVTQSLRRVFGASGKLFRLGGDEFVAIIYVDDKNVERKLSCFNDVLGSFSGILVNSASVSYGYASKEQFPEYTVAELCKVAEKRMYEAKDLYYQKSGLDRRGQQEAHKALCNLYTKILKINITTDTYQIISMPLAEKNKAMGFSDRISTWLYDFGTSGQVHPDDLSGYLAKTDLSFISNYFKNNKNSLSIFYRRKFGSDYKESMMEIIPAGDYSSDNQSLFLYVKKIDN